MGAGILGAQVATLLHADGAWWTEAEMRDALRRGGVVVSAADLGAAVGLAFQSGLIARQVNARGHVPAKRAASKWEYATPDVTARVAS